MSYSPELLESLVEKWEDLRDQGMGVEPGKLTDDPELVQALAERIEQLEKMDSLDLDRETIDL